MAAVGRAVTDVRVILEALKQVKHRHVARQEHGGEAAHALFLRATDEAVHEDRAEPAALPGIHDGDRRLRRVGSFRLANRARDAHRRLGVLVERGERLVAVVIDGGESLQVTR
jgi:hypothetical protein